MNHGFAHFDAHRRENFVAAALLFLLETEPASSKALCTLFLSRAGLPDAPLSDLGRETSLVSAQGESGRSDLWLRFPDGVLLIEVKSHGAWSADDVAKQLARYREGTLAMLPGKVLGAVLLTPRVLGMRDGTRLITWGEVIRTIRGASPDGLVAARVVAHLERHVERDLGLPEGGRMNVRETARQVAALREFLKSCVRAVDGKLRTNDPFWMTPGDGEPLRNDGWAWRGMSVPFDLEEKEFRIGVYDYVAAPAGCDAATAHAWLEAYRGGKESPVVELAFEGSLALADLDALRQRFVEAWRLGTT